ncbi:MAG: nucleoside triphosphate pyrophosphohydrolase, partial [Bacteroidales bacterium]|nr:nucleoside triphosphate pyrophosphohydrolase [Bacteroidales bacterium]
MIQNKNHIAIDRLLSIMDELREKCPWDRKQTLESLRYLTIEEMYELSDAIIQRDLNEIKKELGDIMLHIVFYSKIGSELGAFDFADVVNTLCDKLELRHPHVFGDVKVENSEDVKNNWEKIKLTEGRKSVLEGVPHSLPAMVKAYRIQEKVSGVGFDWNNVSEVLEKVKEEIEEFKTEQQQKNTEAMEEEFGDVLFALINYARFLNINPEDALERTNRKFIKRFQYMENQINKQKKLISSLDLEQMDVFWE